MNEKRAKELNKLLPTPYRVVYDYDLCDGCHDYGVEDRGGVISLDIDQLGNCCGIASVEEFDIIKHYPPIVMQAVIEIAEHDAKHNENFTEAQCSIVKNKSMENVHKTILKCGWKKLYQFKNRNSANTVVCYYKNLYSK